MHTRAHVVRSYRTLVRQRPAQRGFHLPMVLSRSHNCLLYRHVLGYRHHWKEPASRDPELVPDPQQIILDRLASV